MQTTILSRVSAVRTILLFWALSLVSAFSVALADSVALSIGDRTISLKISETSFAVRSSEPITAEQFAQIQRGISGADARVIVEDLPDLARRRGILLFRAVRDGMSDPSVDPMLMLGSLSLDLDLNNRLHVFDQDGVRLIHDNRFIVRFSAGVDEDHARRIINTIKGHIVSDAERKSGRYTIELPLVDESFDALNIVSNLNALPEVSYAYPDFIRVYPARLPDDMSGIGLGRPEELGAAEPIESSCVWEEQNGGIPDDPFFVSQWSLVNSGEQSDGWLEDADIDADMAWQYLHDHIGAAMSDVTVAVLDLGVSAAHPELVNRILWPGIDLYGGISAEPHPDDSHGTAVAAIIAAITNNATGIAGIAPAVRILPVKIAEAAGNAVWSTEDGAEWRAIRDASRAGASIIVASWHISESGSFALSDEDPLALEIYSAIEDAIQHGSVVVFATGNHRFISPDKYQSNKTQVAFPANLAGPNSIGPALESLIAVGATDPRDMVKVAAFDPLPRSGKELFIPGQTWGSGRGPAVSVVAPGVCIVSARNNSAGDGSILGLFSGTSFAAPMAAAAAAMLLSVHPSAEPAEIKTWLQDGAERPWVSLGVYPDILDDEPNDLYGHGRLNVYQSLLASRIEMQLAAMDDENSLGFQEEALVEVLITRGGKAIAGVAVRFVSEDENVLKVKWPTAITDNQGRALAKVIGISDSAEPAEIELRAYAEDAFGRLGFRVSQ